LPIFRQITGKFADGFMIGRQDLLCENLFHHPPTIAMFCTILAKQTGGYSSLSRFPIAAHGEEARFEGLSVGKDLAI
jgi:hypothetical protein